MSIQLKTIYLGSSLAAFCGVAYELLLASYATYLLGASIMQYSLVLSLMMASMGVGSLLSQRLEDRALPSLIFIEMALATMAIAALPTLYYVYSINLAPKVPLIFFVIFIGMGLGMEIPLLNRLLVEKDKLSQLLFFDYLGGFVGGILFPLILVHRFGFFQIAGILSVANIFTGMILLLSHYSLISKRIVMLVATSFIATLSLTYLWYAKDLRLYMEQTLFGIGVR